MPPAQGQEEMMYLEGHTELKPSPWAGHSHWQAQNWPANWSQLCLWMARRRGQPGCIKNHCHTQAKHGPRCHLGDQDRTTTTQRLTGGQCLAQVTLPRSDKAITITQLPRHVSMEEHPGDPRACILRAGVRTVSHKELPSPPLLLEGGVTNQWGSSFVITPTVERWAGPTAGAKSLLSHLLWGLWGSRPQPAIPFSILLSWSPEIWVLGQGQDQRC